MTNPPIPKVPFPLPVVSELALLFHDWQKYVQTAPNEFVFVVPFKLVMFGYEEIVYCYGYLFSAVGPGDVLNGHAFLQDEDFSFNPENGWEGGDTLGPATRQKVPVAATLKTVNGHPEIDLMFGGPQQYKYTATLTAVAGHDATYQSATVLTGDRTGTTGGKVLASFSKESVEKTHWPLAW